MKAENIPDSAIAKAQCDWIIHDATMVKNLISYDSDSMIAANKTRALTAIDTMMLSLNELKAYIEEQEKQFISSLK